MGAEGRTARLPSTCRLRPLWGRGRACREEATQLWGQSRAEQTAKEAGRKQPSTRSTQHTFPGTSLCESSKGTARGPGSPELQADLEAGAEQRARPSE